MFLAQSSCRQAPLRAEQGNRSGARKGKSMQLMVQVVANLSDEDIVNLVSYMSSREP